jgi:VCBS repeat-containing protein
MMGSLGKALCSLAVAGVAMLAIAPQAGIASAPSPSPSAAAVNAVATTPPTVMSFACVSKATDLMSYTNSPSRCGPQQRAVALRPGPVFACAFKADFVYQTLSKSQCPTRSGWRSLTLPPAATPVYFCAAKSNGMLAFAVSPLHCTSREFAVVVVVAHQPPVLANIETSALQYYGGTPPAPITSNMTVASTDASTLAGGDVTISAGLVSTEDDLSFTNQNGITGSYNAATGTLTLTGIASLASYQAALRSVAYSDSDALGASGSRTIGFQVNDGSAGNNLSNVESRSVDVSPNSPPTASDVSASTDKNTAIDIDVLASASDPDGDPLSVASINTNGTLGSVSINPDGTIHYDPNGEFASLLQGQAAVDTFTYEVTDGFQNSNSATVTVTISGVNGLPVLAGIESSPLSYQAQAPAVPITTTLTVSDLYDSAIASAAVAITSGFDAGADELVFTNQNGITGSYNASTGVLDLTGIVSIGAYQTALQSVEFFTSDNSVSPATRTVSMTVTDSSGTASNTETRDIDVSEAN